MNEMNFYTLNGERYELADKANRESMAKANQEIAKKANLDYLNQNFASAIPVTMAGTAVATDMVSTIPHEIKCRISGVTDLASVQVFRCGKNIAETSRAEGHNPTIKFVTDIPAGTPFTISGTWFSEAFGSSTYRDSGVLFYESDYQTVSAPVDRSLLVKNGDFRKTYKLSKPVRYIYIYAAGESWPESQKYNAILSNFQIEIGKNANPEFENPIPCETFKPNPDGIVSGITSVSPGMTILTDNPNVTIEAAYNADTKKYIDSKFTELQAAILSTGGNV